jgi:hypothetical protein
LNTVFPKVQIGQPLRCESLSVFPLSSDAEATAKYLLEKEAFRSDAIVVKEVNKDGASTTGDSAAIGHCRSQGCVYSLFFKIARRASSAMACLLGETTPSLT